MHILYNVTVAHAVVAPGLLHAVTIGNHSAKDPKGSRHLANPKSDTNTTSAESWPLCVSVCACISLGNLCNRIHMWSVDPRGELSHHQKTATEQTPGLGSGYEEDSTAWVKYGVSSCLWRWICSTHTRKHCYCYLFLPSMWPCEYWRESERWSSYASSPGLEKRL